MFFFNNVGDAHDVLRKQIKIQKATLLLAPDLNPQYVNLFSTCGSLRIYSNIIVNTA